MSFLELPRELRDIIYVLALPSSLLASIERCQDRGRCVLDPFEVGNERFRTLRSLLSVSRMLRAEACDALGCHTGIRIYLGQAASFSEAQNSAIEIPENIIEGFRRLDLIVPLWLEHEAYILSQAFGYLYCTISRSRGSRAWNTSSARREALVPPISWVEEREDGEVLKLAQKFLDVSKSILATETLTTSKVLSIGHGLGNLIRVMGKRGTTWRMTQDPV